MAWYRCGGTPSNILALPTPSEASGAIARFNTDLTENLLSAVAEFSASQASGTPSPSTPIPIIGVDKVNVVDTGKNFFNPTLIMGERADTTTGEIGQFANSARSEFIKVPFADRKYTFSGLTDELNTYISWYDKDKNYISRSSSNASTEKNGTFPTGSVFAVLSFVKTSGQTADISIVNNLNIQLENSEIATTFEPFGTTVLINLGGTYYGGSVDAVTGKIPLTHKLVTYNGSEQWSDYSTGNGYYRNITDMKSGTSLEGLSDWLPYYTNTSTLGFRLGVNNNRIYIYQANTLTGVSDVATWKTYLSNNPLQAVYPLATPIVVYASNTAEIPTIVGDNQVFADTGDVAVKYFETVGHKVL